MLPLGLRSGLTHFPWATCAIIIGTTMYALVYLKASHEAARFQLRTPERQILEAKTLRLFSKSCHDFKLEPKVCDKVTVLFSDPDSLNNRVKWAALQEVAGDRVTRRLVRLLIFHEGWEAVSDPIRNLPEFQDFEGAKGVYQETVSAFYRKNHILARDSHGLWTVLRANLLHGGLLHLFGNLLVFALLAVPVERRFGSIQFTLFYFAVGSIALLSWALVQSPQIFILGASGGVFGVAGAFAAFFWRQRMRVWVSVFFLYSKVVYIPAKYFFPLLLLAREFGSAISPEATGVAHGAHLAGFIAGAGIAWLHKIKWPLADGFIDHRERRQVELALAEPNLERRLKALLLVLDEHSDNGTARTAAFMTAVDIFEVSPESPRLAYFLERHLSSEFEFLLHQPWEEQADWLKRLPLTWNLGRYISRPTPRLLLTMGDRAARAEAWLAAFRIYDLYLEQHGRSVKAAGVRKTMISLIQFALANDSAAAGLLESYFVTFPKSPIHSQARPLLSRQGEDHDVA